MLDFAGTSIDKMPRHLPLWELIRNDLGSPSAERIAKALGVGTSTVHRWNATSSAPRVACLALFWLTRWGRSETETNAHNDAVLAAQLARSMREERDQLQARVDGLHIELASREYELEETRYTLKQLQIEMATRVPPSSRHQAPVLATDWFEAARQVLVPALLRALTPAQSAPAAPEPSRAAVPTAAPAPAPPMAPHAAASVASGQPLPTASAGTEPPSAASLSDPRGALSDPQNSTLRNSQTLSPPVRAGGSPRNEAGEPPKADRRGGGGARSFDQGSQGGDDSQAAFRTACGKGTTLVPLDPPFPTTSQGTGDPTGIANSRATLPGSPNSRSHQGAQAPERPALAVTRVVAGRVVQRTSLEGARAAAAGSLQRGLNGPFPGAEPQTPAPRAPASSEQDE